MSPSNILLFHLGVIESLLCMVFLIFSVPLLTRNDEYITAHTICSLNAFFTTLLHPIALWTVCGLNFDKYYAISAPLHYNAIVNSKKVFLFVFFIKYFVFYLSIFDEIKFICVNQLFIFERFFNDCVEIDFLMN